MKREAVALKWNRSLAAPVVVAKGKGLNADRILELAKETGVFIVEDEWLPSLLMPVEVTKEIPVELYEAVAKILASIYNLKCDGKP